MQQIIENAPEVDSFALMARNDCRVFQPDNECFAHHLPPVEIIVFWCFTSFTAFSRQKEEKMKSHGLLLRS